MTVCSAMPVNWSWESCIQDEHLSLSWKLTKKDKLLFWMQQIQRHSSSSWHCVQQCTENLPSLHVSLTRHRLHAGITVDTGRLKVTGSLQSFQVMLRLPTTKLRDLCSMFPQGKRPCRPTNCKNALKGDWQADALTSTHDTATESASAATNTNLVCSWNDKCTRDWQQLISV